MSHSFLLRLRNVADKSWGRIQNTYLMFSNPPPPKKKCRYGIMWRNIVEPCRRQMTIWRLYLRLQTHSQNM